MCGITATIGHPITEEQLLRSIKALKHRGPDGNGTYIDKEAAVGLAHTRLSIIDLATGSQPLFDQDEQIVLICNGEIYDFERIREDLEKKGHIFTTKSDSEVIIYLYKEYGSELFEHLRGEFAFILFDKKRQLVIAGRDRFGIKPLYIAKDGEKIIFSSEAKGIFATGLLRPRIDPNSVRNMLSFVPVDCLFEGIVSVKPGCFIEIDVSGRTDNSSSNLSSKTVRYWDIDLPGEDEIQPPGDLETCSDRVRTEFDEAVKLRMRADVPVGVYLSGGIDSAAVAGTIAKNHENKLHAFTIAFTDNEDFNELALAEKMAKSIDADLHVAECGNEKLLKNLEDSLWISELPTANLHGVGKFLLSALARKHVKVVLTGEGSDETFLGYEYFKDPSQAISKMFNKTPDRSAAEESGQHILDFKTELGFVPQQEMIASFTPKRQAFFGRLIHPRHQAALNKSRPMNLAKSRVDRSQVDKLSLIRKIQYFSIKGLMTPYILSVLGDRQEMAHAIEGRTPLLDHKLFEMARHIPDAYKIHGGVEKFVFRHAMKDRVIPDIFKNKKWPYSAPPLWVSKSENKTMKGIIAEYLSTRAIKKAQVFNPRVIRKLRIVHRLIPFDTATKRRINVLLMFVVTVQMLQKMYEVEFDSHVEKFSNIKY